MEKPTAHWKVLEFTRDRAKYGDGHYPEVSRRLGKLTGQDLESKDASWHRTCYQNTVHTGMCKRAKDRYEKNLAARSRPDRRESSESCSSECGTFTRFQSVPYERELCFFCDVGATKVNPLHTVATENAGRALKKAVELSDNERLCVKLNTGINPEDAHAIDIKYHKRCWAKYVTHVHRRASDPLVPENNKADDFAAEVEFLSLVKGELLDGKVINMGVLQTTYTSILSANNVRNPTCSRPKLKKLLKRVIPDVEFHKAKHANEPERVSIKCTRDAAIQLAENSTDAVMKALYDAASVLRKAISKAQPWSFSGSLLAVDDDHLPKELYSFFRWVIQGPNTTLSSDAKSSAVNKNAISLAQTTVSMFLSKHQVRRKTTQTLKTAREKPQQLEVGVAIRQAIRSKKVFNILHGFGISVEYNRLLRMETQIATSVVKRMMDNDGLYLPPYSILGRYIFFAVDNVDTPDNVNTPDGKRTLHGTAMAIYQRCHDGDETTKLELDEPSGERSLKELPSTVTMLLDCPKPAAQPPTTTYSTFKTNEEQQHITEALLPDAAWLLGRSLVKVSPSITRSEEQPADKDTSQENIPIWSGYHSLASHNLPTTRVGTPPLLAAPAHEWKTLLTILMLAQGINAKVVGPDRKTVISLDMGLYKPAKLQMARSDMNHLVLRPGELHIVMAQLRPIGSYIENSGLDFSWTEADLYGPAIVKQILEGRHVRRAIEVHVVTTQTLFLLYQEACFEDHPELVSRLTAAAENIRQAYADGSSEIVQQAHAHMVDVMKSLDAHCDAPVHADGDGHATIHQVSSKRGLEPSSP